MGGFSQRGAGLLAALASFLAWGVMPLYWHLLKAVPSVQIVLHRIVWGALLLAAWLILAGGRGWARKAVPAPRTAAWLAAASSMIGLNWLLYIWAVNTGHVVETALGYFLLPLCNVLLGVLFFRESLHRLQWLSVAIAGLGVAMLFSAHGGLPWIALALAVSFALYTVFRRCSGTEAVHGLAVEHLFLLPLALGALFAIERDGTGIVASHADGGRELALLVLSGVVTMLPFVGYAYAVKRVPLSTVGLIQYLAPTTQLLVGVLVLGEPFDRASLQGFACIWLALALFAGDAWMRSRGRSAPSGIVGPASGTAAGQCRAS